MNLSTRIVLFLAATVVAFVAESLLAGQTSRAADDCITKPNAAPPQGSHWYYRTDRATQRQCWYLRAEGDNVRAGVQQPTVAAQPPSAPKPVPTPAPQAFDAAPVESTALGAKAAKDDLPVVVASLETSGLGRPNQRMRDDVLITSDSAHERSTREMLDGVGPSDLPTAERPAGPAITFAYLLAMLTAVLVLVGIVIRTIFRLTAVRKSRRTNVHDWSDLASESSMREHVESPSLGEKVGPEPSNAAASHSDVVRLKMNPTQPMREYSWPEIEAGVRLLLQELQQRQHHNERFRMQWR